MKSSIFKIASFASLLGAICCLVGVFQGVMLFTGKRAKINVQIWGSLFFLFIVIFMGSAILLWRERKIVKETPQESRKIERYADYN